MGGKSPQKNYLAGKLPSFAPQDYASRAILSNQIPAKFALWASEQAKEVAKLRRSGDHRLLEIEVGLDEFTGDCDAMKGVKSLPTLTPFSRPIVTP